jgi:hypothetical protein
MSCANKLADRPALKRQKLFPLSEWALGGAARSAHSFGQSTEVEHAPDAYLARLAMLGAQGFGVKDLLEHD